MRKQDAGLIFRNPFLLIPPLPSKFVGSFTTFHAAVHRQYFVVTEQLRHEFLKGSKIAVVKSP